MELLIGGCLAFLITHLGVSGTPLRDVLQKAMGEQAYLGVYSLVAIVTLGIMIYGYSQAPHSDFIWLPSSTAYTVAKVLVLIGILFIVMGLFTQNPTQVMNEKALDNGVTGMLKITRHAIQWGILLFSIGHLTANGDVASILLFGTTALLSLVGMFSMDGRRRQQADPKWEAFLNETSMVPFGAIISGRTKFTLQDINWVGLVVGLAVYGAIFYFHQYVSGGVALV